LIEIRTKPVFLKRETGFVVFTEMYNCFTKK